ncbi:MAG: hypothetical protein IKU05_00995 [Bacteroidales bacterium]|nr:hypothetical protein [Bacteroidales bacterium]
MKKFSKQTKAFVIAAAMVVMLLLPTTSNAQTKMDGFFNSSDMSDFVDRTSWEFVVINQQFGNQEPLGSGLIIMTVAGASYVALRRKKED